MASRTRQDRPQIHRRTNATGDSRFGLNGEIRVLFRSELPGRATVYCHAPCPQSCCFPFSQHDLRTFCICPWTRGRLSRFGWRGSRLRLASGTYFGLNDVGTRIWQLIAQQRTLAEIGDVLGPEFDILIERLKADLLQFLDLLVIKGLLLCAPSGHDGRDVRRGVMWLARPAG